jgi:Secretion system C-terminal sorting domain
MKYLLLILLFLATAADGQIIVRFAGGGSHVGDGGPATAALLDLASGGAFDKNGNYYVCELLGNRVRKITPAGIISTITGTGVGGFNGDGIPATSAELNAPSDVLIDSLGNIYINDHYNFRIRKIDAVTGLIFTIAGTGTSGYNGDNIPAASAELGAIEQIQFDNKKNLYLCDQLNRRVRKIDSAGMITTIAGDGGFSPDGSGDGGLASSATFNFVSSVAADDAGCIYIGDYYAGTIRKVDTLGTITTIAGIAGATTYIGDNISATAAQFSPLSLIFNNRKELTIGDLDNYRVLLIDSTGIIHNIAGDGGTGDSGDGGPATAATIYRCSGLVYDSCGNLYISESYNNDVRKVLFNPSCSIGSAESSSIAEHKHEPPLSFYPNPTQEELHIDNVPGSASYTLTNIVGAAKLRGTLRGGSNTLSTTALPPGMYLLAIEDEDHNKTNYKIIKQ